tara:strand:- start:4539 stop:5084 length:546 start_codon:yes stop_codon:yes gene_type:complete
MKVAILDRDGVINLDSDNYIKSPDEWIPIDGSIKAIKYLKDNDYKVYVATNQSGIGRGFYNQETLELMHQKFFDILKENNTTIDGIVHCPHISDNNCNCRKPKPGLFFEIQDKYNIDLTKAFCVGDSIRDLEAASISGITELYLVKTGKGQITIDKAQDKLTKLNANIFNNLLEIVKFKIN